MATNDSYNDRQVKVGGVVIKVMSRLTTRLYRLTDGRIGGKFLKGTDVVLVTLATGLIYEIISNVLD